jgi:hypothetical protein
MPSFFKTLAITGFIAGTLDITAATVHFLIRNPTLTFSDLLVRITSGALGKEAFNGNPAMPVYGLLIHYFIAYSFTFLFFILFGKISVLRKQPVVSGLLYGIVVWAIMQYIILPLFNVPTAPVRSVNTVIGIVILMFMIGLTSAIGAGNYYRKAAQ